MNEWHRILTKVLRSGSRRPDRTGVGTLSVFGEQLCFDNRWSDEHDIFPAVTTKKLAFKQVAAELASFIQGYDNVYDFNRLGCDIWDGNAGSGYWKLKARFDGDLGRIYGVQWREWLSAPRAGGQPPYRTDQLALLLDGLRKDPFGRRHVVTAWNPGELDQMCLPPCHVMFQAYVREDDYGNGRLCKTLDLRVDMRSVDLFLGLPFDVASYALLQRLLAQELGMESGWLTFQLGDAHIYLNHLEQVHTVLMRQPFEPPRLWLAPDAKLLTFRPEQASLLDYYSHPAVKAPLNV